MVDTRRSRAAVPLPLAMSVPDAGRAVGLSRSRMFELVREGAIPVRKCGKRSVILTADLTTWLESLPCRTTPKHSRDGAGS